MFVKISYFDGTEPMYIDNVYSSHYINNGKYKTPEIEFFCKNKTRVRVNLDSNVAGVITQDIPFRTIQE